MDYTFTEHARKRIKERSISEARIREALENPSKILSDDDGRLLIKKVYKKKGKERLLLIVVTKYQGNLNIITVIETSKVKKYLR